jgi:membrane associated rhomboid family serine protease
MEEPAMATSFEQAGTRSYRIKMAAWWTLVSRYRRLIVSLIILPMLAFVAAGSWLVWTVTSLALGRQAASLAVAALVGTTFAISREFARRP